MTFLPPSARARQLATRAQHDKEVQAAHEAKQVAETQIVPPPVEVVIEPVEMAVTLPSELPAELSETEVRNKLVHVLDQFEGVRVSPEVVEEITNVISENLAEMANHAVSANVTLRSPETAEEVAKVTETVYGDSTATEKPVEEEKIEVSFTKTALSKMTKEKLLMLAGAEKVVVPESATKATIIDLLLEADKS